MRRALSVVLFAAFAACDSGLNVVPTNVSWMDWPSEVVARAEFTVHLVVGWPCGGRRFQPGATIDESAVTYGPSVIIQGNAICPLADMPVGVDVLGMLDTADIVPGLPADFPRTYEMRASSPVYAQPAALDAQPVRTFGEITVRTALPPPGPPPPRNAAGFVFAQRDTTGCVRITPIGLYQPRATMALENPPDTVSYWWAFVRGYIDSTGACGAFRTFHLVSRN